MKNAKTTAIVLTTVGIMVLTTISHAQEMQRARGGRIPVDRITAVLIESGCPLTQGQIEQLENTDPGPGSRGALRDILTEEQLEALVQNRPPRDRPGLPRFAMNRILEEAGCPLTENQITSLKELERGPGLKDEINKILTDEQVQALESAKENARGPESRLDRLTALLEKAGYPLSESQINAIRAIDTEGDVRAQMAEILTEEQKEVLSNAGPHHNGRQVLQRISAILEEGGQPLTEEQLAEIKATAQDPNERVRISEILTDAQKEVLSAAQENHPEGRRHPGRVLEEAGCPLTEEQRAALLDMPRDIDRREAFLSILTDEQKQVLEGIDEYSDIPSAEKTTAVDDVPSAMTVLHQNYPNPFNPTTTIKYSLTEAGPVTIEVFNSQGQRVTTLADGHQAAGYHTVTWDASNQAAGVYMCRMTFAGTTQSRSMTLVK